MKLRFMAFTVLLAVAFYPQRSFAQNAVVTYQGSVQDSGTNFTGTGQFQFALVTSSNANLTATATAAAPVSGFITTISVTFGGNGYVTAPAVAIFGGGGSNATATASISSGVVTAVTINSGGNGAGYTNAPNVVIAPPPPALAYTTYWSNDGTSVAGSEPSASIGAGVTNGLFMVGLGDTTILNMAAINAALFRQPNLQLQIWFNDGVNGFAALSPVQNLTASPYAAFANNASNLLGSVPATQISGMVPNSTLPTNAVFSGPVTATSFSGSGTNLTSLNASSLVTGIVPLTCLSGITSNQLDATTWQIATNLNGGRAALASNVVSGIAITNAFITNSAFAGNGGGLTNLSASQLVSIGNTAVGAAGNFFAGAAGNSTMTGYNNTGIGVHALAANVSGLFNTAEGLNSLLSNTAGTGNTAIGTYALQANVTGGANTAIGLNALYANTNGNNNTATGMNALYSNTNGANTADGANALQANVNGSGNTAIGFNALFSSSTGSNNIALGYLAGQTITTGSSNIDIGNPGFASDANVIRIGSSQSATYLVGNVYTPSGTVQSSSDRNLKENFTAINPQEVLNKVSAMPLTEWQYKVDAGDVKHIGPMAQDF
ncbi:MAG TPA: tail fiber domain-containing protein, partial [Pseudomonadales bacterium]|nr:tail fiber domain-containing protein [Pseudomonadales bacterium]